MLSVAELALEPERAADVDVRGCLVNAWERINSRVHAGDVAALSVAKIVLSWPLYLLGVTLMGLLLVRGHTPLEQPPEA